MSEQLGLLQWLSWCDHGTRCFSFEAVIEGACPRCESFERTVMLERRGELAWCPECEVAWRGEAGVDGRQVVEVLTTLDRLAQLAVPSCAMGCLARQRKAA